MKELNKWYTKNQEKIDHLHLCNKLLAAEMEYQKFYDPITFLGIPITYKFLSGI